MSFGHAILGIGGYAVGMLAQEGVGSGFIQFRSRSRLPRIYALVIGALSLRTRGVYFIMTLAFAQMAYYVASGLARYGGDDGSNRVYKCSQFRPDQPVGTACSSSSLPRRYADLAHRQFALRSRLAGLRSSEQRMQAIGFPANPATVVAFVISGYDVRPCRRTARQQHRFHQPGRDVLDLLSGPRMVMAMGTLFGPVMGARWRCCLEEFLSQITEYGRASWAALAAIVLFGRGGSWACSEAQSWLNRCSASKVCLFGGIVATDNVSLDVASGEWHVIIGPNGAGN